MRVTRKRMSTMARAIRVWWKVDFISGLGIQEVMEDHWSLIQEVMEDHWSLIQEVMEDH